MRLTGVRCVLVRAELRALQLEIDPDNAANMQGGGFYIKARRAQRAQPVTHPRAKHARSQAPTAATSMHARMQGPPGLTGAVPRPVRGAAAQEVRQGDAGPPPPMCAPPAAKRAPCRTPRVPGTGSKVPISMVGFVWESPERKNMHGPGWCTFGSGW